MPFRSRFQAMAADLRQPDLLAQRQVVDRELTGELIRVRIGRRTLDDGVLDLVLEVNQVGVARPGDGGGRRRVSQRRHEGRGDQIVARSDLGECVRVFVRLDAGDLPAAQAEHREAAAAGKLPGGLELRVVERRQVLIDEPLRHEIVVRPARGGEPRSLPRSGQPSFADDVGVRDARRRRAADALGDVPFPVLDDDHRRQPVAVLGAEATRHQLEPSDRLRVERAGESEQAIRVVNLHAVHDREVLIRRAAADRQLAAELVGAGNPRQGLEGPERVVEAARGREHFLRTEGNRCRSVRSGRRRRHLDALLECGFGNQPDLDRRHALRSGFERDLARGVIAGGDLNLPEAGGGPRAESGPPRR